MNYCGLKDFEIANGPGVRVCLYVSGCSNACPGCFQPETWDPNYGKKYTKSVTNKILKMLEPSSRTGITILGGDPLYDTNYEAVFKLICDIRNEYKDTKSIWLYTGYDVIKLLTNIDNVDTKRGICTYNIFDVCDVIVDGPFIQELKDISLTFKGSSNQRFLLRDKSCLYGDNKYISYKNNYNDTKVYTVKI